MGDRDPAANVILERKERERETTVGWTDGLRGRRKRRAMIKSNGERNGPERMEERRGRVPFGTDSRVEIEAGRHGDQRTRRTHRFHSVHFQRH